MQQQMHHQQMVQQDQIGNQQQHNMVQQQMMLCPVRLVYETPSFLVQQGDQVVQQNQNIFLNPQNPPPWARPVQNQVIYVQQLQPNMVPIQQVDANQLYLQQNLANYQQLLNQQMMNQTSQEQRQIQMQMQIPNMMSNVQALAPNIPIQNELPMSMLQNYTQAQQTPDVNVQNTTQNQINLVPDPNNASRQIVSVQTTQTIHQNAAANQKAVELQRQTFYRNVVPQNQQQILRPQMPMAINQVQNMTSIQQIQQLANQNFAQNLRPTENQIQQIVGNVQPSVQPVMINAVASMQTQTQERTNVNLPNNTVTYSAVRNGQSYTFRAIQPKPPQYRSFSPINQVQRLNAPNHASNNINVKSHPIIRRPAPPPSVVPAQSAPAPAIATQTYKQPEPQISRKRKSESPDEVQKKISLNSTVYGSITVTPKAQDKFDNRINKINDIGVNTNIIYKPQYKIETTQAPVLQINPMDVQFQKIKEESSDKPQSPIEKILPPAGGLANPPMDVKDHLKATLLQAEKDKLARSTVFPQARGRMLNDTTLPPTIKVENKPKPIHKESTDAFTQTVPKKVENKAPINLVKPEPIVPKVETKPELIHPKVETNVEEAKVNVKLKEEPAQVKSPLTINNNVKPKPETPLEKPLTPIENSVKLKVEKVSKSPEKIEKNIVKAEQKTEVKDKKEYKNISPKDISGKEIHIVNGSIVKEDKDFVLTHVLDGYVIQESNVPFAIRRPLKEKTVTVHSKKMETDLDEELKTEKDKGVSERVIKDNSKILDLSHLQLHDGKVEEKDKSQDSSTIIEETNTNDNPFNHLRSGDVKCWTVDELTDHLSKHNWQETANILREHEIDGESLFLVSKSQLITIGVKDTCADIVCDFVSCK